MRRRVEKKARARNDLVDIFIYLGERDMDVAERFLVTFREACDKLAEMPGMGTRRGFSDPQLQDVRSWPIRDFENYLIFYRPIDNGIEVVRVVHGARNIDMLFRS